MSAPHTTSTAIEFRGVSKRYGGSDEPAVVRLDLAIPRSGLIALIGPSGCGKTTTLRMINRLIEPTEGSILIDGRDSRLVDPIALRLGIGYVIQAVGLFPHRRIADNIAVVPKALGWDRSRIRARVRELADLVGLEPDQLDRYPDELSGGQQQRVGVARALAADPPILLMDEPFGAVDPVVRARLQEELLQLQARLHKTIVLVTHDLDEAVMLADRIALFDRGGRLAQYATPDELLRSPAEPFVEEFLGEERSLRRLALLTVGSLALDDGPIVELSSGVSGARALADASRSEWIGVVDADRFVGWVRRGALVGEGPLDRGMLEPPAASVSPDASLRAAMDRIMTARSAVAVVEDAGRFVGIVTLDSVRAGLARSSG
jgi:osmoprotectant transport system ATP-binding protein